MQILKHAIITIVLVIIFILAVIGAVEIYSRIKFHYQMEELGNDNDNDCNNRFSHYFYHTKDSVPIGFYIYRQFYDTTSLCKIDSYNDIEKLVITELLKSARPIIENGYADDFIGRKDSLNRIHGIDKIRDCYGRTGYCFDGKMSDSIVNDANKRMMLKGINICQIKLLFKAGLSRRK